MRVSLSIGKAASLNCIESRRESAGKKRLHLLTDSQDVQSVKDSFGNKKALDRFECFFVSIENGDIETVYGCENSVPSSDETVYNINLRYS